MGVNFGAGLSGGLSGAAAGSAILPGIGTIAGGAIGLIGGLFGNRKPAAYQLPMTKEDIAKRNAWLSYVQNKIYDPNFNRGNQAAGQGLDMMSLYKRPGGYFGAGGTGLSLGNPVGFGGLGFGQPDPNGAPALARGYANPYMDILSRRNQQQQPAGRWTYGGR